MNTLSFLIYLADVVPNLGFLFFFVAASIFIYHAVARVFISLYNIENPHRNKSYPKLTKTTVGFLAFFALGSAIIPSTETMYLIAASEMGEVVVQSEEALELYEIIKERISTEVTEE